VTFVLRRDCGKFTQLSMKPERVIHILPAVRSGALAFVASCCSRSRSSNSWIASVGASVYLGPGITHPRMCCLVAVTVSWGSAGWFAVVAPVDRPGWRPEAERAVMPASEHERPQRALNLRDLVRLRYGHGFHREPPVPAVSMSHPVGPGAAHPFGVGAGQE